MRNNYLYTSRMARLGIKHQLSMELSKILKQVDLPSDQFASLSTKLLQHSLKVRKNAFKEKDAEYRIRMNQLVEQLEAQK